MSNPTILLVQGSFQTPQVYSSLVSNLQSLGYPTVHPALPSCTDTDHEDFPTRTLTDDARAVTRVLEELIENESKTVLVVMHSYGGIVGSEAVPESLSFAHRQKQGQKGGVVHLFYFAAFVLDVGESVLGKFGESPNNLPDGRFRILNGAKTLYNDLPEVEAELWESRLIPQSYAVQTTAVTRAACEYIPSTYLVCENDAAVPAQFQEMFAGMAKAQEIQRCSAGHSPMLSQTRMLVDRIVGVVNKVSEL
ncbi:alpha/beta hydrolase [Aspergillus affinis]|uniref:alpha/beta hydrolase n=1 Tax=Aspergillus affinis TaxID=1070780 RepID=UPI0022FF33CA|nr:catalytic protein [Aspergillus affinis]KAI9037129.1 catalytic protein [Aspergillus affinis]